jgi:hypothetical protein
MDCMPYSIILPSDTDLEYLYLVLQFRPDDLIFPVLQSIISGKNQVTQ